MEIYPAAGDFVPDKYSFSQESRMGFKKLGEIWR